MVKKLSHSWPLFLRSGVSRPSGCAIQGDETVLGAAAFLVALHFMIQPLFQGGVGDLALVEAFSIGGGSLVLWGSDLLKMRRLPAWPRLLWVPLGASLLMGWISVFNAEFSWDARAQSFQPVEGGVHFLPGCVDANTAFSTVLWGTLQAALLLSIWDYLGKPALAWRLWAGVRWGGACVLALGIVQKAAESDRMFFSGARLSNPFFGSFFYSGSAAAYINLLMPVYVLAVLRRQQPALSFAAFVACCACLICNTSRIGFVVGILQLCVLLPFLYRHFRTSPQESAAFSFPSSPRRGLFSLRKWGAVVSVLIALAVLFPMPPIVDKWRLLPHQWTVQNARVQAWRVAWAAAQDASVWGMGAGCFPLVFPQYARVVPHSLKGRWMHAHCDYLELWIERGGAGCLIVAILGVGTAYSLISSRQSHRLVPATALAGVLLHAVADFPFQNPTVQLLICLWMAQAWQPLRQPEVVRLANHRETTKS